MQSNELANFSSLHLTHLVIHMFCLYLTLVFFTAWVTTVNIPLGWMNVYNVYIYRGQNITPHHSITDKTVLRKAAKYRKSRQQERSSPNSIFPSKPHNCSFLGLRRRKKGRQPLLCLSKWSLPFHILIVQADKAVSALFRLLPTEPPPSFVPEPSAELWSCEYACVFCLKRHIWGVGALQVSSRQTLWRRWQNWFPACLPFSHLIN